MPATPQPAGYSGTPLPKKLGIQPGHTLVILDAPDDFDALLIPLPDDVTIRRDLRAKSPIDVAIAFATTSDRMAARVGTLRTRIASNGAIWCAWPKRASGVPTDITEDVVRQIAFEHALVDNKVCAIDATWSGLRLVIRLKDR
ncbi:MAG: hypothetical protein R3B68_06110 [Phycisphaerales bacterium]